MEKIKVALMYDFDKTLSPKDMQEFSFIPSVGFDDPKIFWKEVDEYKNRNKMDSILAYMYMMLKNLIKHFHGKKEKYIQLNI